MKSNIYLLRHGQTDYNLKGIVQGRGVNSSLNHTGRWQAQQFYESYKNIPFDVVYTSTLQRTHQTIEPFIHQGLVHLIREELDEIDWGIFEGVAHNKILESTYVSIMKSWTEGNLDVKIEGGESPLELHQRQYPFIQELRTGNFKNILICSHGRAIRALLCGMLGKSLSEMDTFLHNNTCLYHLQLESDSFHLLLENDTSHLLKESV
ncbi:MAG: histidine phosphatase family protein [Chitinophagales bacterium]|nr:histidine phosphatase family protein [Chitinophagales bacterium]MCZ2394849.1 histidine phosphatase family protein [Chitinophagales bacterium]